MSPPKGKVPSSVAEPPAAFYRAILESISDGVFTVDRKWRITWFNAAAERITGIPRLEATGRFCHEVFRSSLCEDYCALRETLETGNPVVQRSGFIVNADGRRIPVTVTTAVLRDRNGRVRGGAETFRDLSELDGLRRQLENHFRFGDMIGRSNAMRKVMEILPAVADSVSTVLILGETGSGKEVAARAIHNLGPRKNGPFVALNCAALPDTLLEAELFGYRAGAFTGAARDRTGRIAVAEKGTLFLDEIGDLSAGVQVKLLRLLQDHTYEPLGDHRTRKADVRIIAATHRDLENAVEEGRFRSDLYYRIHVVPIHIPPLRERREDIPLLAEWFVRRFNHMQGRHIQGVHPDAMVLLMGYHWPGNVRELENAIERAYVLCRQGMILSEHLPAEIRSRDPVAVGSGQTIIHTRRSVEAATIRTSLEKHNWNRGAAAAELGIHRSTLFRKMRALGIRDEKERIPK
ncbi:MAG TPA: PAS domain S-box protein [Candidatus Aminicenantes bacterium]|nr:PAS domain S-box protein [Candidatus Aminicenantes bacterium]